jgi:DHA1 family multidrug resistance protein-like MFS transporter
MGDILPPHRPPYVLSAAYHWSGHRTSDHSFYAIQLLIPLLRVTSLQQPKAGKWPILELEWISALAAVVLFAFLPETLESNILHKRAQRLRKLTGNQKLRSQGEIDTESIPTTTYLLKSFARPPELAFKPAVLFANVYIGLFHAIFYLWFEAFPFVFNGIHGFRQDVSGLPFLSFVVSAIITFTFYCEYIRNTLRP